MAAVLARAVKAGPEDEAELIFADDIPQWAQRYVARGTDLGLIRGFPDRTFRSDELTTRAQACTVMWRTVDLLFR